MEKFYLMSFLLMDIHVKQMQGVTVKQLEAHIGDAMDLVDRVYEAGKERGWTAKKDLAKLQADVASGKPLSEIMTDSQDGPYVVSLENNKIKKSS